MALSFKQLLTLPMVVEHASQPICRLVQMTIPMRQGALANAELAQVVVGVDSNTLVPASFTSTASWPDGSVQQLAMTCLLDLPAGDYAQLCLFLSPQRGQTDNRDVRQQSLQFNDLSLSLASASMPMHKREGEMSETRIGDGLLVKQSQQLRFESHLPLPIEVTLELIQSEFKATGQVKVRMRNPNRAEHVNGLWDLGDRYRCEFDALSLSICAPAAKTLSIIDAFDGSSRQIAASSLHLTQYSSGGEQWQSPSHVDASGQVPFTEVGFSLTHDADSNLGAKLTGRRCEPEIHTGNLYFKPEKFWQNFPAGLSVNSSALCFELFAQVDYSHELQPGEQKTFTIEFGEQPSNQVYLRYPTNHLAHCGLLPSTYHSADEDALRALVAGPQVGPAMFFQKREQIDEYGWRNFGDIWADHETENYQGSELFISHYNNQYDPLYGFLRQYLIDGNPAWFELASDLAKHIIDIDIYHTEADRPEYNGGLFWHTDHFCQAHTCGHRTYSKHQAQGIYDGHVGGGGPGGQHCYTTGLVLYYWLTGDEQARDAVIGLTNWITNYYEGSNGFFEAILSLRQSRVGLKNFKEDSYSFDRGTANYINALMDCSLITNSQTKLDEAGLVLKKTFSDIDDLDSRRLEDVESSWFYTVFLQSSIRFMYLKSIMRQFDSSLKFNLDALLKYAEFMASSEYPYLDKPDILEFPNTTWAAQDLRKAAILASASSFVSNAEQANRFRSKSKFFSEYVYSKLAKDNSLRYTRIQAILMQNSGFSYFFSPESLNVTRNVSDLCKAAVANDLNPTTNFNFVFSRLKRFNFSNEIFWLKHRFPKLDSFLSKIGM